MGGVISIVGGRISAERVASVAATYRDALKAGPPPEIEETFLLQGEDGDIAVLTVWRRREDLDALLASGTEPFARRLIREAGGAPEVHFFDVIDRAGP